MSIKIQKRSWFLRVILGIAGLFTLLMGACIGALGEAHHYMTFNGDWTSGQNDCCIYWHSSAGSSFCDDPNNAGKTKYDVWKQLSGNCPLSRTSSGTTYTYTKLHKKTNSDTECHAKKNYVCS